MKKPNLCETVRFVKNSSRGRVTYRPDWAGETRPWISYIDGTAGQHFETLEHACAYFESRGYKRVAE